MIAPSESHGGINRRRRRSVIQSPPSLFDTDSEDEPDVTLPSLSKRRQRSPTSLTHQLSHVESRSPSPRQDTKWLDDRGDGNFGVSDQAIDAHFQFCLKGLQNVEYLSSWAMQVAVSAMQNGETMDGEIFFGVKNTLAVGQHLWVHICASGHHSFIFCTVDVNLVRIFFVDSMEAIHEQDRKEALMVITQCKLLPDLPCEILTMHPSLPGQEEAHSCGLFTMASASAAVNIRMTPGADENVSTVWANFIYAYEELRKILYDEG